VRWNTIHDSCALYTDESGSGSDRFRSVAALTGRQQALAAFRARLCLILKRHDVGSVEWKDLHKGKSVKRNVAASFLSELAEHADRKQVRADILVWDTKDSRHSVPGRHDIKNLERMYYKILRHAGSRWASNRWRIYPDEHTELNWPEILGYFSRTRLRSSRKPELIRLFDEARVFFEVTDYQQLRSHEEPLIQVADLLNGLAIMFRKDPKLYEDFCHYSETLSEHKQNSLFGSATSAWDKDLSNSQKARIPLAYRFDAACKAFRLGVSLRTNQCFCTMDARRPINFWLYAPQHDEDKAPTRN
jgi:hypothetical protein